MDSVTGRRVCELVAGIIATDGVLHPDELKFMLKTFEKFGVASGEEDEAVTPVVTALEAQKAMKDLPEEVRTEALGLLVQSAAADGNVSPDERKYLLAVGKAAGIGVEDIDARIAEVLVGSGS